MTRLKFRAFAVCSLSVLALGIVTGYARYAPTSVFLGNPELTKPYVAQCADFWKKSYDEKYGGFFTMVKRDGRPDTGDEVKTTLTQSRHAYGFARAYMMTGKREYLDYARRALDFLYDKCRDKKNGGFHTTLDRKGDNLDGKKRYPSNGEKWSFMQHYALLGNLHLSP